jgi:hypothetical protein
MNWILRKRRKGMDKREIIASIIEEMEMDITVQDVISVQENEQIQKIRRALRYVPGTGKGLFWKELYGRTIKDAVFVLSELEIELRKEQQ